MTSVATNLVGRWVKGHHLFKNPDYVYPEDRDRKTTETQKSYWLYRNVTERVVAVSVTGEGRYQDLKFWVLIDGRPSGLEETSVMPEGWEPEIPR